jgi:signal transduction histidine kinase
LSSESFNLPVNTLVGKVVIHALGVLLALAPLSAGAAAPKRILIVHSFGNAAPPFTTASSAFETTLIKEVGEPVDLDEVFLDVARYATLDMEEALVDLISKRQVRWQPDLVVPIGSPAGVFVAQYRDRLFSKTTPIVYTGMDPRRLPAGALQQNATFTGSSYDLPGAVEDILKLAPATTNIVVVIGASPLEQFWTEVLRREYQPFTNRVGFTWFNDLSFDQMLERSARLPPHSFMLLILLMQDAAGVTHNEDDALRRLHDVANAPMNGLFNSQFGMGIVGGRLYSDELEGVGAARVAIRVLHGEPATNFAPRILGALGPCYDWRELQRWGISERNLPAGSVIRFRQPTFWQLYMWHIVLVVVVVCTVLGALHYAQVARLNTAHQAQAAFTRQLIVSQESERKRIASDLHDGLGQDLLILKNQVGLLAAAAKYPPEVANHLTNLSTAASRAIAEVRSISQALRPVALEQVGLTKALDWMIDQMGAASAMRFSKEIENIDGLIAPDMEINLYRIIQEALTNVIKHASASEAIVELKRGPAEISLSIFDNGRGFNPQDPHSGQNGHPTLGLVGMAERARLLSGKLEIQSALGKGARLTLSIPLPGSRVTSR